MSIRTAVTRRTSQLQIAGNRSAIACVDDKMRWMCMLRFGSIVPRVQLKDQQGVVDFRDYVLTVSR